MVRSQSNFAVDMIVVMPTTLFSEKDYRDYRYFYKRAFFLAYITDALRKKFSDLDFVYAISMAMRCSPFSLRDHKRHSRSPKTQKIRSCKGSSSTMRSGLYRTHPRVIFRRRNCRPLVFLSAEMAPKNQKIARYRPRSITTHPQIGEPVRIILEAPPPRIKYVPLLSRMLVYRPYLAAATWLRK